MNYAAHYGRLIARARGRILVGYRERHHVLPRCLGGGNESANIVELTAEEHYVAHQLLVLMNPRNGRLVHAAVLMSRRATGNKSYGWLRRRHAAASSQLMRGNKSWLGRKHTDEWKAARRAEMLGKKMPASGVEKMAATKRGKPLSAEHRAAISTGGQGLRRSAETCSKISASRMGISVSPEARRKIAEANRKRIFTPETRERMAASHRGKKKGPTPPEVRAKISAAHRARRAAT